jgi:hypothetical protein
LFLYNLARDAASALGGSVKLAMALNTEIWYSQKVQNSPHTLIREKFMLKAHTCYLPNITAFFCIDTYRLGAGIIVSDITEQGGRS